MSDAGAPVAAGEGLAGLLGQRPVRLGHVGVARLPHAGANLNATGVRRGRSAGLGRATLRGGTRPARRAARHGPRRAAQPPAAGGDALSQRSGVACHVRRAACQTARPCRTPAEPARLPAAYLLDRDEDLGRWLPPERAVLARRQVRAPVAWIERGPWHPRGRRRVRLRARPRRPSAARGRRRRRRRGRAPRARRLPPGGRRRGARAAVRGPLDGDRPHPGGAARRAVRARPPRVPGDRARADGAPGRARRPPCRAAGDRPSQRRRAAAAWACCGSAPTAGGG